jgi:hypothetical protein
MAGRIGFFFLLCIPSIVLGQIKYTNKKTGLGTVTSIQHAGDGSNRIFVASKTGVITILDANFATLGTLLNISSLISTTSEMGLLGLAFHPDYATNGFFYVNYNPSGTRTSRIARFTQANPSANTTVNTSTQKIIIDITGALNNNHKAGDLAFGPDGYLYITTGDGGGSGDPQGSGQNGNTLLGKILRLDINTTSAYLIPAGNPFVSNASVLDEIWDLGLRNPWRFSFDRNTGDLWIADVGQGAREEINFEPSGSGGKNYGWNCVEGNIDYGPSACGDSPSFTDPIFDYTRCSDPCPNPGFGRSVTGGYVYRGTSVASNAALRGFYIFADYASKHAWILKQNPAGAGFRSALDVRTIANLTSSGITSFGEQENGEILAGTDNGSLGAIDATRALPVRLAELEAKRMHDVVTIRWTMGSEAGILGYDIERSKTSHSFTMIGSLTVKNSTEPTPYEFIDRNPYQEEIYYRLVMHLSDGTKEYSRAMRVAGGMNRTVYYDKSRAAIQFAGNWEASKGPFTLNAIDHRQTTKILNSPSSFSVVDLPAGIYFLQGMIGHQPFVQKIFIY